MSGVLVNAVKDLIRGAFTQQQVMTVDLYGGEFNAAEIDHKGFSCPAVLLALLGWRPRTDRGRDAVDVRLGAFIVTKNARREDRMLEASTLAQAVGLVLRRWKPADDLAGNVIYRLDETATAENLYGRKVDEKGLALWLVSWEQTFVPAPGTVIGDLYDLLRVEIEDTTHQGTVPAPAPGPTGLVVTEDVQFKNPI